MLLLGDVMVQEECKKNGISKRTLWITQTALVSACAIVLSMVESMLPPLPVPIPGAKIGLSNIATMFSAQNLGLKSALVVTLFKAVFAGVTRGGSAFTISLCAGVISTLVMYSFIISKGNYFGYIGIAVFSAVSHNVTQLSVASVITDSSVFVYLPLLLITGVIAGVITGLALGIIMPIVRKTKMFVRD